ncbi:hypothetical protein [Listeria costaricensis]|uniref:hypothetical protein n=1 Tax=Listeria costaricensis TaxID=2026604 RepID=UPI000C06C06B|nr:hypothetical protein [Listeria costaricensis]
MTIYYFEKPDTLNKNQPVEIKNSDHQTIAKIMRTAAKILYLKEGSAFASKNILEQECAYLTLELGWSGKADPVIVYHDKKNQREIAFEAVPDSPHILHIHSKEAEFPIDMLELSTSGSLLIKFHQQESAFIQEVQTDSSVSYLQVKILVDNTNMPDNFFLLSYFIFHLIKNEC